MIKIAGINNGDKNRQEYFTGDSLFQNYDFTTGDFSSLLIHSEDVKYFFNKDFHSLSQNKINNIFNLLECQIGKINNNFTIYENGTIKLGFTMKRIKENLDEYEQAYEEFKNREYYNKIKISFE